MTRVTVYKLLICISLSIIAFNSHAQRMFFNTTGHVYELAGGIGHFNVKDWGHFCLVDTNSMYSSAMHGDTLYILTATDEIYQINVNTGACNQLGNLATLAGVAEVSMLSLVCDKSGLIYTVGGAQQLIRYDPHINQAVVLGVLPLFGDADLVFYKDTLLYAADGDNIYAINPEQPSDTSLWMVTKGYGFYGLMAYPDNCQTTRLFGLDGDLPSNLVEIDPVTRSIKGVVQQLPFIVMDAASTDEDGEVPGLVIDSLAVVAACGASTTGTVQVFASSGQDGNTNYTLDGSITNTVGLFPGVAVGAHAVEVQTGTGCTVDSVFTLSKGLSALSLQLTEPQDCAHANGVIQVLASSQALPIVYTLDTNPPQISPDFGSLTAGQYKLVVQDGGHCEEDTTIDLSFLQVIPFPGAITITPAFCQKPDGAIAVELSGGVDPALVTAALNSGGVQTALDFSGLRAGTDTLHVYETDGCRYDSMLQVPALRDPEPVIAATIGNQHCYDNNGSVILSVTGVAGPYQVSQDGGAYSTGFSFSDLGPGTYVYQIQDANTCVWDTSFTVQAYPRDSLTLSIDTVDPVCTTLNSGAITVSVEGGQGPYSILYNNTNYNSGSRIDHLTDGSYSLPVIDEDGCVVDSMHVQLGLEVLPQCSVIDVPNAFTPNGDGNNDIFRVIHSPYLPQVGLQVYDRYGELLFSSSDAHPGWDGTFHSVAQPSGTYVWVLHYLDFDHTAKMLRGTVLLIR